VVKLVSVVAPVWVVALGLAVVLVVRPVWPVAPAWALVLL
jgi:hypothetical protein